MKTSDLEKLIAQATPLPFECENCGHKPTLQEVLDNHGDCAKCRDTVIAYTVDSAECILRLSKRWVVS